MQKLKVIGLFIWFAIFAIAALPLGLFYLISKGLVYVIERQDNGAA